jgi:hypothetical protein
MTRGLTAISRPDLEALLSEVESGRLRCPLTEAGLMAAGLGHLVGRVGILGGLDTTAVIAALQVALAERERPRRPELIWTGPEASSSEARDTAVVVRQLFREARQSVLLGGYAMDSGGDILRPLHDSMRDHGVEATLFLNLEGRAKTAIETDRAAVEAVTAFMAKNWPFGEPTPEIYYDPRSLTFGAGASQHAKFLTVDGQRRNIEAGVLIDDESFAGALIEQWRGLVRAGLVRRCLW